MAARGINANVGMQGCSAHVHAGLAGLFFFLQQLAQCGDEIPFAEPGRCLACLRAGGCVVFHGSFFQCIHCRHYIIGPWPLLAVSPGSACSHWGEGCVRRLKPPRPGAATAHSMASRMNGWAGIHSVDPCTLTRRKLAFLGIWKVLLAKYRQSTRNGFCRTIVASYS